MVDNSMTYYVIKELMTLDYLINNLKYILLKKNM